MVAEKLRNLQRKYHYHTAIQSFYCQNTNSETLLNSLISEYRTSIVKDFFEIPREFAYEPYALEQNGSQWIFAKNE